MTTKNREMTDQRGDSSVESTDLFCRRCGRETKTPERCQVCAQEDEIRAAPDLLDALEELLIASECADETGYVTDVGFLDLDAIHAKARTAISKARGQNVKSMEPDQR